MVRQNDPHHRVAKGHHGWKRRRVHMGTTGRKNKNKKKRTIRERQRDQYVLQLIDSWWGWLVRERIS